MMEPQRSAAAPSTGRRVTFQEFTGLPPALTVGEKLTLAENMAKAQVFPGVQNQYQALAAIEIGEALGMAPGVALMSIEFGAQGKPSISVHWQAGKLQERGWRWEFMQHDAATCKMQFFPPKDRGEPFEAAYSMSEAKATLIYDKAQGTGANLAGKWNYKSWAADMLYAFIMRRIVRRYEPSILGGFATTEDQEAEQAIEVGAYEGEKPTREAFEQNSSDLFGDRPLTPSEQHMLDRELWKTFKNYYTGTVFPLASPAERESFPLEVLGEASWEAIERLSEERLDACFAAMQHWVAARQAGADPTTGEVWGDDNDSPSAQEPAQATTGPAHDSQDAQEPPEHPGASEHLSAPDAQPYAAWLMQTQAALTTGGMAADESPAWAKAVGHTWLDVYTQSLRDMEKVDDLARVDLAILRGTYLAVLKADPKTVKAGLVNRKTALLASLEARRQQPLGV